MSMKGSPATGTFTAAAAAVNISCGFTPSRVVVTNITSRDGMEWNDTMSDGHALKTVAAGTRTALTSNGITPYAGVEGSAGAGFTIGADADVMANAEVVHWIAWGKAD